MIVTALQALRRHPTFVNGGVIAQLGASSGDRLRRAVRDRGGRIGRHVPAVRHSIALITNVDPDHLDHYGTDDAFVDAFATFANRAREAVVISSDDSGARAVAERLSHPNVITFGEADAADVRVSGIRTDGPVSFTLSHGGVSVDARSPSPERTTRSMPPARSPSC